MSNTTSLTFRIENTNTELGKLRISIIDIIKEMLVKDVIIVNEESDKVIVFAQEGMIKLHEFHDDGCYGYAEKSKTLLELDYYDMNADDLQAIALRLLSKTI